MRTGPMSAALKSRVLGNTSSKTARRNNTPSNKDTAPATGAESTEPAESTSSTTSTEPTEPSEPLDDFSDDDSSTLVPSSPDLTPLATDDMSVDEGVLSTTTSNVECSSAIQLRVIPALGVTTLVQTSLPALFNIDMDERPQWLLTAIHEFLQHGPYYLCLGKVVDLFLTQEARLGYPAKVSGP